MYSLRTLITVSLLIGSAHFVLAQDGAEPTTETESTGPLVAAESRTEVPDFSVETLTGDVVRLSDYAGKVVVINFWATWCVPCLQELPFLEEYYKAHLDDGLVVLAVTSDGPETLSQVRSVARRGRWTMPVLLDHEGAITALLNPRDSRPLTLFVDRTGRLAYEHEGYTSGVETEYLAHIQTLLAEPTP